MTYYVLLIASSIFSKILKHPPYVFLRYGVFCECIKLCTFLRYIGTCCMKRIHKNHQITTPYSLLFILKNRCVELRHDDVIKWSHIPRYWLFVRGIHQWSFAIFFDLRLNNRLSKQSIRWWFVTPSCTLGRLCNAVNRYGIKHLNV